MNTSSRSHGAVRASTVLALCAVSLALAGCTAAVDAVGEVVGGADIYEITYEITTREPADGGLADVSYMEAEGRGQPSIVKPVGEAAFLGGGDAQGSIWSVVTYVTAEETAFVQAAPVDGAALQCRILVDGEEEIASSASAAGQPVTCEMATPPFD